MARIPTKRMPTVMKSGHDFARLPSVGVNRSVFDRSHGYKTTFDAGLLIPIYVDEVLPGDTFTLKLNALVRFNSSLVRPLMDNLYLESFFFFVPYRLVWTNFVKFMGEQASPGDSIAFTVPQYNGMPATGYAVGTIYDYMGLPTAGTPAISASIMHSTLPLRAFWLIYNQWFRDENLCTPNNVPTGDGPDTTANSWTAAQLPPKRGKRHDYFTSCLPFVQKGTAVSLPLGSTADVYAASAGGGVVSVRRAAGGNYDTLQATALNSDIIHNTFGGGGAAGNRLYADLSSATAATVNDLRQAVGIQQFLERDARGGTRYIEIIYSHFRVRSDDARLQRSEYLGGGSSPIFVAPVAQQTQGGLTGGSTALGYLGGVGAGLVGGHGFSKSFTEHGVIIGIVNVRADLTYSQGVERMWSRSTRYDLFWPVLEELGEQAVLSKEIYADGTANDALVFGYQERYAEYRYKPSKITGVLRPTHATSLEAYHLSEEFTARPTLGQTFIEDQTETILDTRVNVPSEPDFVFDSYIDLKCARPMKVFGVPGLHRL